MFGSNGSNEQEITQNEDRTPRISWLNVAIFGLVLMILYAMGLGLSEVVRGLNTELIWPLIAAGLAVGWGLVRFGKRLWSAGLVSLFSGALVSAAVIGRLWDEIGLFYQNMQFWWGTAFEAARSTWDGEFALPSFGTFFVYLYDLTDSFFVMLQRLVLWVWRFPRLTSDLIANVMAWGLIIWLVVTWLAWFLWKRKRPLEAVLPAFLVVAIARTGADASSSVVLTMLGLAIAMMVLSAQADRESDWVRRGLGYSEMIRRNATQSAMLLSLVLVVTSAGITSIDIDKLRERWEEFTTKQENTGLSNPSGNGGSVRVVSPDEDRVTLADQFVRLARGGLPTNQLVGSGPELSDEVVMVVRVEELNPISGDPLDVDPAEQNYYFRALNYDIYTSPGWFSSTGTIFTYRDGQEAITTYTSRQRLIRQEVRYDQLVSGGLYKVHAIGDLAVVNRMYNVSWRIGKGLNQFADMFGATVESRSYEAYSVVPAYSEDALRNVLPEYPDWMIRRYLYLPETVPDRVIDLAYELTSGEITTYDKAVAIEQYLRTFPYTLDLPAKPANIDIADYFLFDVQRGYCDYYASTMVVLARAVGIPARLAVGYIGGTYDEENDYYVVTADQAHSWAEIYFDGYGWVTFEPTAGRTEVERDREGEVPQVSEFFEREIIFEEDSSRLSGLQITLRVLLGLVVFAVLGFIGWLRFDIFLLKRQNIEKAFARMYRQLQIFGRILQIEQGVSQTPLEFAERLGDRIEILRYEHPRLKFLEKTPRWIGSLVSLANKAAYHAEQADAFDRAQAVGHWVVIRRHLGFALLWHWLAGLAPKIKSNVEPEQIDAQIG